MKINTSRFGEIEIHETDLISIPNGLIGFSDLTQFILLHYKKNSPFKWLQSTQDGTIAFLIVNPTSFYPDYTVEISKKDASALALTHSNDAIIALIVTVPNDTKKISANLKAPLIFNLNTKTGAQLVLKETQYQTKHLIIQEEKKLNRTEEFGKIELEKT